MAQHCAGFVYLPTLGASLSDRKAARYARQRHNTTHDADGRRAALAVTGPALGGLLLPTLGGGAAKTTKKKATVAAAAAATAAAMAAVISSDRLLQVSQIVTVMVCPVMCGHVLRRGIMLWRRHYHG